jgi:Holliday junction resolvasome RuvABC DNA-binding subunit
MIYSLTGKIIRIESTFLIIENQGIGYRVWITHPDHFSIDQITTLMTHQVFKEDDLYLFSVHHIKKSCTLCFNFFLFILPEFKINSQIN